VGTQLVILAAVTVLDVVLRHPIRGRCILEQGSHGFAVVFIMSRVRSPGLDRELLIMGAGRGFVTGRAPSLKHKDEHSDKDANQDECADDEGYYEADIWAGLGISSLEGGHEYRR
jgi:hypothetical protein